MIISASRRTDLPALYSEWFFNRLKTGYVWVQHLRNPKMFSKVFLQKDWVDCFVFWSKNPLPMFTHLELLKDFAYYFQFTLTPYGREIEPGLPTVDKRMETFKRLSDIIGTERVIWRYDPVFISPKYTMDFHMNAFNDLAFALKGYTQKCIISWIDSYRHIQSEMKRLQIELLLEEDVIQLATRFSDVARGCQISLETCAESIDLSSLGISHGACIDKKLIGKIIGYSLISKKDSCQRAHCQCTESIDIGGYNTCTQGCVYCYATTSLSQVLQNKQLHDVNSPKLIGVPQDTDQVIEKLMKRLRNDQQKMF